MRRNILKTYLMRTRFFELIGSITIQLQYEFYSIIFEYFHFSVQPTTPSIHSGLYTLQLFSPCPCLELLSVLSDLSIIVSSI